MASKVITVLSAGGGCGATTFAVNLANEIQLLSEHDTLLIDFDMYYGPIAASLDISARYSINEVMEHTTDIDAQLLLSTAMHYSPRLNVLISPAATDLNAIHPIKPETLSLTLAACRSACRYTVLDAPRLPMDATSLLASESDVTYVVLHPTVCHVRTAKILFKHFESAGLDMDRVHPVLADLPRAMRMISATDIRKALDKDQIHEIAYDPKTAVRCINYGKMVAETAPRSALRKSVLSVSKTLAEKKQEGHGNR